MSEYSQDESSPPRHGGDVNLLNSLDDSANNSIIGKVKSRVSSIFPNRLSKWFSPSTKLQNDPLNGSLRGEVSTQPSRRRRRIEIEEEQSYEDGDDHYCGVNSNLHLSAKQERDVDNENDEDDDSQYSEYEYNCSPIQQTRRDLNFEQQPPAKRSRLNVEVRDSPCITRHQPILSSTPDIFTQRMRNSSTTSPTSRYNYQRYTHLNLYGDQNKKEPAFNFGQQRDTRPGANINTDIIDLITNTGYERDNLTESGNIHGCRNRGISSRRSLNITSSTSELQGCDSLNASIGNLKRQPMSSAKADFLTISAVSVPPRRTSTTIHEVEEQNNDYQEKTVCEDIETHNVTSNQSSNAYNGCMDVSNNSTNKRQKLINGTSLSAIVIPESNDSASESGESVVDVIKLNSSHAQHRKAGLFNMSATASTRNNSRTSSFGNGLNFYSHLEGRKSLFNSSNHGNSYPINNSTLSLTSLNRRQFNASIYGSTSALSDSRLLNTFSPFYKGKTTYGGAAAYNKYAAGAGASTVRITPTLIRPTSSLSNLSSCNSLTNNVNSQVGDNSAISSTAKRILDLINDFTTPLSDAKKMAGNLKTNSIPHVPPQAKARLNEKDLNESRSIRLSQVQKPYSRSAVIIQPSGNASGRGIACGILPPVKELQVPTMSQLLQMKKMQSTTEKVRKITQNSRLNSEYTLPDVDISKTNSKVSETEQQKHTNKIRNKITKTLRATAATKDLEDEEPPTPVNLPNIAFPLMQSVPKIDIQLNKTSEPCKNNSGLPSSKSPITTEISNTALKDTSKPAKLAFNFSQKSSSPESPVSTANNKKQPFASTQSNSATKSFKFSEPLQVIGNVLHGQNVSQNEKAKYKFSPPLDVTINCLEVKKTQAKNLHLKDGSCLDALKKPFTLPPITSECSLAEKTTLNKTLLASSSGFGNKFKKASNEWECDACLLRNKSEANQCVACQTPMKQTSLKNQPDINSSIPITSGFGQQFKKSSNDWECEACMLRNKEDTTKCIACETPRKCVPPVTAALPFPKNSFGDVFKPKSGTWECQTCMISNKNEVNECIACQTKKPGSTNASNCGISSSQFKFGFTNANNNADAEFKTLAAQQKVSKWECDACMTRNDVNRTKCACCEQPKPGTSNAESATTSSTKFQFGATAASKFSFGFGTGSNAAKEEDIRKELSSKAEQPPKPTLPSFGTSQLPPVLGGFQFGIKPTTISTDEPKNDVTDSNKKVSGFQLCVSPASAALKVNEKTSGIAAGLETGSKLLTTTVLPTSISNPIKSSAAIVSSSSVKLSLPSTTTSASNVNNNKGVEKNVTLPVFGFGGNSTSSTTTGFSFGGKIEGNLTAAKEKEKASSDSTAFKEPATKSSAFAFTSSPANTSNVSSASFGSNSSNTIATTTATTTSIKTSTTPAVKPVFSFGTNTANVLAINSQSSPALSSLVFGSNATNNVAATTNATTLFGAVTSTVTSTTNATTTTTSLSTLSTVTTTPASANIFGSFGGGGSSNTSTPPIFGSSVNPPANNNSSSVSSSTKNPTPQFGTFGSKNTSNVFGTFDGSGNVGTKNIGLENQKQTKFTAPTFGIVAPNSTTQPSQSDATVFGFGSKSVNNTTVVTTTSITGSLTSTSTTWPKSSFVFGSNATSSTITSAQPNENQSKDVAKTSLFGTFASSSTNSSSQQQTSSIFGVPASNNAASLSSSSTSSTGPTSFSTNLFNTNSAPATTNIFGANPSGNAVTPAPAFGSSPFGGTASSTSATPTFGSTAATGTTFGNFGGSTSTTTKNTTEVKKPEAAFNFGATPAAAQNTSGGFNFGLSSSTTKPAFNFGGTSTNQQPTFNFTGAAETQSSTKPFQFGANTSASVFNFNRSVVEGTPNAPFQFNAGAAPVSSNIFAPTPTAGAPTAQQAKRKMRAQIRRVTQR